MGRQTIQELGERELDLMQALWRRGEASVGEVQRDLESEGVEIAYTTVQTLLNRLVEKGAAIREKESRAYRYRPALKRPAAVGRAVSSVVERFFAGSAEELARHLVESDLDPEELDRLQRFIDGHAAKSEPGPDPEEKR